MFNGNFTKEDVVVVQEKMKLNPQFFKKTSGSYNFPTPDGGFTMKIQRNLRDDTFNMMFKDVYKSKDEKTFMESENYFNPFININGVDSVVGGGHTNRNDQNNLNSYFVHRSMENNIKFRDTKSISLGVKNNTLDRAYNASYRISIYPQFETLKSSVRISKNNVLDFQSVNGITIRIKEGNDLANGAHLKSDRIEKKMSYSHTILVPRILNRIGKNITVFDAFIYNDKYNSVDMPGTDSAEGDIALQEGKIKTTSFKKSLSLVVNDFNDSKTKIIEDELNVWEKNRKHKQGWNGSTHPKYIGSFNMFDQTSYDYEKGESVVGSSSTSREGEVIPYSLKGGYYRESTLGVNEIYKKIKVLQTFTKLNPILQPDVGLVKMEIKTDELDHKKTVNLIDPMEMLKDNNYIYPLKGLERLSEKSVAKNE